MGVTPTTAAAAGGGVSSLVTPFFLNNRFIMIGLGNTVLGLGRVGYNAK
jgi:hypothetical protein